MSMTGKALGAACLALAFFGATAQTATTGAPPTHPATGGSNATSTPSPTTPPTHPAGGTSAATPEAARDQNPILKNSPSSDDAKQGAGSSATRAGTSPDPTSKDGMPTHPAVQSK